MFLILAILSRHTSIFELLHLRHAFLVHLFVLSDQPQAQDRADHRYKQTEGGRYPQPLLEPWRFGIGEDVRS